MPIKRKSNARQKPSFVGGVAETFFPVDLMESSAEGIGNDLKTAVHAVRNGRNKYQVIRVTGPFQVSIPNGHYFPSLTAVKKWAKNLVSGMRPKPKTIDVILH